MDSKPTALARHKVLVLSLIIVVAAVVSLVAFLVLRQKTPQPSPASTPIVRTKTPLVRPRLVATGLKAPTAIAATPNPADKRLFALEQAGTIRIITAAGHLEATPFLDISSKVLLNGEMGLLGLAFHPSYKQNGYFYVNYINKDQNTVIARYQVQSGAKTADPASEKILFTVKQPYSNHNGGDLAFGPDSYLYLALGDGGSAGDPENRAQDKASYFGKILRIDVNKGDSYTVPPTNPFVHDTNAKPEIWAYGLRNPWRISFDKKTGDLYIADVGQGKLEEINIQKAASKGGENYGWRCYEGKQPFQLDGCGSPASYTPPTLEYDHLEKRCSVTGGYVYRGTRYISLEGKYFYGDFCNGQLFYANKKDASWTSVLAATTPYMISAFGQRADGELYFADFKTGSVYHIEDTVN